MVNKILLLITILLTTTSCLNELFEVEYRYEVTGTSGDYSITMQNTDDNTEQHSSVGSGWWYKWEQSGERWLYISAQNNNDSGTVTVKIYRNGKVVESATSSGAYVIATANGTH